MASPEEDSENSEISVIEESDGESVDSGGVGFAVPDLALLTFEGPEGGSLNTVAVHPSGSLVAAGGEDDVPILFRIGEVGGADFERQKAAGEALNSIRNNCPRDEETWAPSRRIFSIGSAERHGDTVSRCGWSHDGALFASAGYDGKLRVYVCDADGLPAAPTACAEEGSQLEWFLWHPKGNAILAGGGCGTSWLFNGKTGDLLATLPGLHSQEVTCGKFCGVDLKTVATASLDGALGFWDPISGRLLGSLRAGVDKQFHRSGVLCMDAMPGSVLVATGSEDSSCRLESCTSHKVLASFCDPRLSDGDEDAVHSVAFRKADDSRSSAVIACGTQRGGVLVWDSGSQALRGRFSHVSWRPGAPGTCVTCLAWHPTDPSVLISGGVDGCVCVWDIRAGEVSRVLTGHRDSVFDMKAIIDADGGCKLITASEDGTCKLWGV